MSRLNPFAPTSPVNPGMFVGRIDELRRLEGCLQQTKAGQPHHFLITGERGIGKSSLLNYIKPVAEGRMEGVFTGAPLSFLVVDTDLSAHTTRVDVVDKIRLGLENGLAKSEAARTFFKEAWGILQRVKAGGIEIKPDASEESEEVLVERFAYTLAELSKRLTADEPSLFNARHDGILILIDEADNASQSLGLGTFLKLLTERLERRECNNIVFGLAGLPEVKEVLATSHPSSLRLFEEVTLDRLREREVSRVIDICLERANQKNPQSTSIDEAARKALVYFAEGYPHFIQQFGWSAFDYDTDNLIDLADTTAGALGKDGALEHIGERYYRGNFYNKIQSDKYRAVLRIMAERQDSWITKPEIRKAYKGKDSTLTNAIKALLDREIIIAKEGSPGVYRLQHRGFAWWIKLQATDPGRFQEFIASLPVEGSHAT